MRITCAALAVALMSSCAGRPQTPEVQTRAASARVAQASQPLERSVSAGGIRYVFRASRLANLAWQLDCLAGFGRCSEPAYFELWREPLSAQPELSAALARWKELRLAARGPVGNVRESRSGLPLPRQQGDLWQRVRLASIVASTPDDYEQSLQVLTNRATAAALRAVLVRFDAAFDSIWARALPPLERAMREQAQLIARAELSTTVESVVAFYGGAGHEEPKIAYFDLLFRPPHASADYGAQVLDRSLIEVVPERAAAERIQVPMHELFHALFAASSFEALDGLATHFVESPEPSARAAYGLLDEVLATSFAQGELGRQLMPTSRPHELYADPLVDRVAQAFLPKVAALLEARLPGGTVFGTPFFDAYLAAVHTAFPRGLPPIAELRPLACAYAKDLEPAFRALRGASAAATVGSSDEPDTEDGRALLEDHRSWGRVLLLKSSQLSLLARYGHSLDSAEQATIRRAGLGHLRFAYVSRKPAVGPLFVLVASDETEARRLVDELIAADAPFVGLGLMAPRR